MCKSCFMSIGIFMDMGMRIIYFYFYFFGGGMDFLCRTRTNFG